MITPANTRGVSLNEQLAICMPVMDYMTLIHPCVYSMAQGLTFHN